MGLLTGTTLMIFVCSMLVSVVFMGSGILQFKDKETATGVAMLVIGMPCFVIGVAAGTISIGSIWCLYM